MHHIKLTKIITPVKALIFKELNVNIINETSKYSYLQGSLAKPGDFSYA